MASVDLQEKANFTRLSRLLVDKGTEALRGTFDAIRPPANLLAVLAANRTALQRLRRGVINNLQWDLLFPPSGNPPDSKSFDVTLLTVLFRNICGLPSTGWNVMPLPTDRSMQANIIRIKSLRNAVYAHVTSTRVDNATFEYLWKEISQTLVELNVPQNDVDDLKTCPLGPEEEEYEMQFKDLKLKLDAIEYAMVHFTQIAEENRDTINQLSRSLLEKQSNIEALQCNMNLSDQDVLLKLAKHNFKSKIRRKMKLFLPGTRVWLLEDVHEWFMKNDNESRILLLTAGPGFGKSVFAAKVCEDFKKNGKFAACHFYDFSNSNLRDPMMMLQSLARQMCENIVGFKEKLVDQLKQPHRVQSLKDAFLIYLQNPLDELELDERRLVVIDGLDENAADDKTEIMNLIADYFPDLPEYIKILATSRPEISVTKLSCVQNIDVENKNDKNKLDLELYFNARLPSLARRKVGWNDLNQSDQKIYYRLSSLVKQKEHPDPFFHERYINVLSVVVDQCEGSFLYAYHVQAELQTRDDLEKMTFDEIIEFLPQGLDSIYQAYVKRLEDELKALKHENFDLLKFLAMLVASKQPLPLTFVAHALGLAPDCRETKIIISQINETVSCLLYVSDDQLTVFHKSFIDWLLARGYKDHQYAVKVDDGNRLLWLLCENILKEVVKIDLPGQRSNFTKDEMYALFNGLEYLVECNVKESFSWLVDVVIIHAMLIFKEELSYNLLSMWKRVLRSSAVVISDELRARISWHVVEFKYVLDGSFRTLPYLKNNSHFYLEAVLKYSPKGYFSDTEKKIAQLLLSNVAWFSYLNSYEVDFIPCAFWDPPQKGLRLKAVAVSNDKKMVAVVQTNEIDYVISVLSLLSLSEYWNYSTNWFSSCTFAPDDSFVLFGKLQKALSIAERKEVPFFHGNEETFTSCAFSPSGKRLVTNNGSNIIKLWDVRKQRLLSLLYAKVPLNCCSFSNTGLFIIGDLRLSMEDSFCVWNALTCQRSDKRKVSHLKVSHVEAKKPIVVQGKKCGRCVRRGFEELSYFKRLEIEPCIPLKMSARTWSEGIFNGLECIFVLDRGSLSVLESTHFTTIAAWNINPSFTLPYGKITSINNNLLLAESMNELIVFKTLVSPPEQSSCPPLPTKVYSCSFSPDGSRLATCTSDGYINIWNVYTSQVEQRYHSNQSRTSFVCWWSEKFLFEFDIFDKIPNLTRYLVDVNSNILFTQSQQVPLSHLVNEFVSLSAIVDFSEGFLSFKCGEKEPVKVLDVSRVDGPRMITLPGVEPSMSITVSPGGSFVFGGGTYTYYIWERNTGKPPEYEVYYIQPYSFMERENSFYSFVCCFSNDCKVAVVLQYTSMPIVIEYVLGLSKKIIDLQTTYCQSVNYPAPASSYQKIFCINKAGILIAVSYRSIDCLDMDSNTKINSSLQRYFTDDLLLQTKLSPEENLLVFPNIKGEMVFLQLRIPPEPLLASLKCEAASRNEGRFAFQKFD